MARHAAWFVDRFVLPLGAAAWLLWARWGCLNLPYVIAVLLILLLRMFLSWQERPDCPVLENYPPYRRALGWWHNCDVLGLVFLMVFEAATAVAAQGKDLPAIPTLFLTLFFPYSLLIVTARVHLLRARTMAAYCRQTEGAMPGRPVEVPLQVS